jgi:hypothetical protein
VLLDPGGLLEITIASSDSHKVHVPERRDLLFVRTLCDLAGVAPGAEPVRYKGQVQLALPVATNPVLALEIALEMLGTRGYAVSLTGAPFLVRHEADGCRAVVTWPSWRLGKRLGNAPALLSSPLGGTGEECPWAAGDVPPIATGRLPVRRCPACGGRASAGQVVLATVPEAAEVLAAVEGISGARFAARVVTLPLVGRGALPERIEDPQEAPVSVLDVELSAPAETGNTREATRDEGFLVLERDLGRVLERAADALGDAGFAVCRAPGLEEGAGEGRLLVAPGPLCEIPWLAAIAEPMRNVRRS